MQTSVPKVALSPDPGMELRFTSMTGTEELGRPFLYEVEVSSGTGKADLTAQLGGTVCVTLPMPNNNQRHISGILTRVVFAGLSGAAYRYRLEMRPWIWLLSRTQDCRIFQATAPFDIIVKVFRDAGFSDFDDRRQNNAGGTTRDFVVQYRESALDFVTRLMEECGIYYFVRHARTKHTVVLSDDINSSPVRPASLPFAYDETKDQAVSDRVWDWQSETRLQSGVVTYRDYNFTTPSADLTAKSTNAGNHPHGSLEVYDYPGQHETTTLGQSLSGVRMQAMAARRRVLTGATNARSLDCGRKFTLDKHPSDTENVAHLVIGTKLAVAAAEGGQDADGGTDTYRCEIVAIPADVPFALEPLTDRPMIRGPQTAKVVGAAGDEITTDPYGRVKVKFYWDRSDAQDDTASCWIRVAQIAAGTAFGGMFIPRVGQEVVVEFLEGNPDRPLITGVVYNATQTVPYALPANKTRSTIRSNSSKGGNGSNELRFEDAAGSEEVFFQAQKDYNRVVLNTETARITQDSMTTVDKGNRSVTLNTGNDTLTVSQGSHSITVSAGKSSVTAQQSITLTVGSNSITIDASGITLSASTISATTTSGAVSITSAGAMNATAGGNMAFTAPEIALN